PGNNGGDGLVCARHLHAAGVQTRVIVVGRTVAGSDADPLVKSAISEDVFVAEYRLDDLTQRQWFAEAQVVVDALLGTGSNRPIQGAMADLNGLLVGEARARRAAGADRPAIVACDCPSGLNCDTGEVDPLAVPATLTYTFGFAKVGQFKFPGVQWCGRTSILPIGLPAEIVDEVTQSHDRIFVVESAAVERVIPVRKLSAHKGSFGKVMVAAGSVPYPGAVTLACRAAGRVGAGLVSGAVPEPVWTVAAARLAEPTWLPLPAHDGAFDAAAAEPLRAALVGYKALVLGCGITQRPGARAFLDALLRPGDPALPATVIDADALNILAQIPDWPARLRACSPNGVILTPHPAEFARLLDLPLDEVMANRWELARQAAQRWGVVLLAKGPYTVVAHPAGQLAVVPHATPALSTAGTGDVLA
ncbi:MAG: bifunctional ADP-dependent NAD(P)H-hydrate dehydratase/NAD(P)H-hydrate epimerase, partial [Caldilineaceae bacterium]